MLGMIGFGGESLVFSQQHFKLIYALDVLFPQFFTKTLVGVTLRATRNSRRFYGELHFKGRLSAAIPQKPRNCKSCSKREFNEFVLRVGSTFQRDKI
jgi:hypothetical protein